ncbi:GNAT family N-acetyltransferase [uncultured Cytophaga sp.]|uniref:GNAT family N-acetyltransferase n=1 Tax=uncultured Cytophaga sp. TaxID=160238 RepID=UPI002602DCF2|nr:GNAT family N-acetyltransferase [uncultured Cytophaga sp.]
MLVDAHTAENTSTDFLFNQFFYLKNESPKPLLFIDNVHMPKVLLSCVESNKGEYMSGFHAPFGGLEALPSAPVELFLTETIADLRKQDIASLEIKQAPFFYQPNVSIEIHNALVKCGFAESATECNQYLVVDTNIQFDQHIDPQKRRRLKNAKKMGMYVALLDHIDTSDWYKVYAEGRTDKGFPITISEDKYNALYELMPHIYTYAGVYLDEILIATAIFVRVSKNVMYYFLAASAPDYAHLSPTVLLIEALYIKAVQEKCTYVDLGISSVEGVLNEGLYAFKRHLRAEECLKKNYRFTF